MNWKELNYIRRDMGLSIEQMSRLLRVGKSTYNGWSGKDPRRAPGPPDYIAASVEAHRLLDKTALNKLMIARRVQ